MNARVFNNVFDFYPYLFVTGCLKLKHFYLSFANADFTRDIASRIFSSLVA